MKTSKIAVAIILVAIVAMVAPASAAMYHEQSESDKAEKIVEVAEKAEQKVENLIAIVNVNNNALNIIQLTFHNEWKGNMILFDEGTANVTAAQHKLEAEDYEGAIANATQALEIFREVLRSINTILQDSNVQTGQIIDAQGLLIAMQRALDRIDRIRELLDEDAIDALELLDTATIYLDIDMARLWLLDGKVTETAYNMTQANSLISEAHHYLKDQAKESNGRRIDNYLEQMYRARERFRGRWENADNEGVNVDAVLESLDCDNWDDFILKLQEMTESAQEMDDIKDVMKELKDIGRTIREVNKALAQEIGRHRAQHGAGQGNGNNP